MRRLLPLFRLADGRSVKPAPKEVDPFYLTPEYRRWRVTVIERASRRCQWLDGGTRCIKAEPDHRMFADHIIEVQDGGAAHDPMNGQCLCGSHHTMKTTQARARRLGGKG